MRKCFLLLEQPYFKIPPQELHHNRTLFVLILIRNVNILKNVIANYLTLNLDRNTFEY